MSYELDSVAVRAGGAQPSFASDVSGLQGFLSGHFQKDLRDGLRIFLMSQMTETRQAKAAPVFEFW